MTDRETYMRRDAIAQARDGIALDWIDTAMQWHKGTTRYLVHAHARAEHDCSGEELMERWRKDRAERWKRRKAEDFA